ncbi:hypothetical protein EDB19DRAFT_1743278 [Suillus lakei]|nr:hypothetical protein EDB19DRAFT_1743278 [Suillus lakei]
MVTFTPVISWWMTNPEYWELLKALNTRALTDICDWWDYVPDVILGYEQDVAIDRLLEVVIRW